ncbi:MAG TPA: tetratricopeptide repeat protein [Candidatus Methylomirabilis sp.]|nr:tetratricopeptide repeat protein [Candidatus Methylomirabilis sp.]HSB81045.1 tetratricopeptide repeat protein [Candidatus Methylomirabilis sp.]
MRVRFPVACLCVLLLGIAAAAGLLRAIELARPQVGSAEEAPWLPPAGAVRPLFLGYNALAADLFWIRTVQYFGAHIQTDRQYQHLHRLVDLTTSLDPRFVDAYQLGGLFLSLARAYPEAIAIYRKGIEHNPDQWELPYELGRMYFLDLGDIPAALEWFERANKLPGHAHYIPRLVARLRAREGLIDAAIEMWERMLQTTDNEWVRRTARKEIEKLRKRPPPG